MGLAVFDIDGTLVAGPSTEKRFFLHLLRSGRIGPRQLLAFVAFTLRQLPGHGRHVLKKNKAYLTGLRERDVQALASAWVQSALEQAWFQPCIARLRAHRESGDIIALVSGTPQFVADAIGAALGVTEVVGTRCATCDGRYSAGPPLSHPFASVKVAVVQELAKRHQVNARDITAYGDSIYDLPLFETAGTPVAVRPDEQLLAVAEAAGWEVLGPVRRNILSGILPAARTG